MSAMGKHTYRCHLRVVEASSSMAFNPVWAPDPHRPPPMSAAVRRDVLGTFASLLLVAPVEAGAGKAAELDRELLACSRPRWRAT